MERFAERYIQNNIVYPAFIDEDAPSSLSMIVMIPCLNEPEVFRTLGSLWDCDPPGLCCEVIVCVNESESSAPEIKQFNRETYRKLKDWKFRMDRSDMVLYPVYASSVNARFAGAGMARKIGMDEAVRRFASVANPKGIIVSLDADCLVSSNYLKRIAAEFLSDKTCFAATINFKHRFGEMTNLRQRQGIQLYETYLHYYKKALDYAGFPDSIYTIGSAFAVRVDAYIKQGGMNRRQAGEDFYFLNKLTKLGTVREINDAFVYPSARVSDRVPFGTGAAMTKWMNEDGDLTLTYNFAAFQDLKQLFERVDSLINIGEDALSHLISSFPESIQDYIRTIDFEKKVIEINQNSSSLASFRKRFFQYFDAFIILRFLNLAHLKYYSKQNLSDAIAQLEEFSGKGV